MVNESTSNITNTASQLVGKGAEVLSSATKNISDRITEFLTSQGINVSTRWVSILLIFLSVGIIFLGIKITKPILRWTLVILGILLLIGLVIPW